ncbi:MAG: DNA mismatch repair endonuclease MutL [Candidatus Latescibacteria bacterium]|nr:DNA mismatch repair endonuclease MutL [Candidatus Latescibacterota bacterium]
MPNLIRILPDEVVRRIAAGEVIERPASVVKELIENTLDAKATRIGIDLLAGGKGMICVSDNGTGMSKGDTLLSVERHATSKMIELTDIETISTFGFRGEALPSIGTISRMTIETQERACDTGTRVVVDGGKVTSVEEISRSAGTTVTVRDLFFNTPARQKFLRGDQTEARYATQTFTEFALASPDVWMTFAHNGRELFHLEGGKVLADRLEQVFGAGLIHYTLPMSVDERGLKIEGILGMPEIARASRMHQSLFVNRRPVTSRILNHAIYKGYGGILPKGLYPFFVIFLWIDPAYVDVNVHPTKHEVRLSDESWIHDILSDTVKRHLLERRPMMAMTINGARVQSIQQNVMTVEPPQTFLPLTTRERQKASEEWHDAAEGSTISLWQLHDRYIFAPTKGGLLIIDQHVAHERIIYDDVMSRFTGQGHEAQQLLFPLVLDFSPQEIAILRDIEPLLVQIGFGLREFGRGSVMVDAIPVHAGNWSADDVLRTIIDDILQSHGMGDLLRERLVASYSCHTAIRSGDRLSVKEMQTIIDRLFATKNPFVCPHGRPIVIKIPLDEIDQKFGRT